jgi:hypothetical protein
MTKPFKLQGDTMALYKVTLPQPGSSSLPIFIKPGERECFEYALAPNLEVVGRAYPRAVRVELIAPVTADLTTEPEEPTEDPTDPHGSSRGAL